ncbi:hypothetical protein [Sulfitobacter sp. 20_GPM-1509m]|uniref:hypothetical protein n=1 Tax=Sulfitobacter sp. 20_GPM-1509m TaxID=1380367 RepID=UPI00048B85DE|nr:hypothetical protein [Sulfitobacter sp. 20_GPM-1509m]
MRTEQEEQRAATRIAVGLTVLGLVALALLVWGASAALPVFSTWIDSTFSPGLGLKTSAIVAAVVSVVVIVVFAIAAGDGLIGEFQFMVPGFFLFFIFFWLMTAWVF